MGARPQKFGTLASEWGSWIHITNGPSTDRAYLPSFLWMANMIRRLIRSIRLGRTGPSIISDSESSTKRVKRRPFQFYCSLEPGSIDRGDAAEIKDHACLVYEHRFDALNAPVVSAMISLQIAQGTRRSSQPAQCEAPTSPPSSNFTKRPCARISSFFDPVPATRDDRPSKRRA